MRHEIEIAKAQDANKEDQAVEALVTFEREKVQARYTFEMTPKQEKYDYGDIEKKIRLLHIEFIGSNGLE